MRISNTCPNCQHPVIAHGRFGCADGRATCTCLFDYDAAADTFSARDTYRCPARWDGNQQLRCELQVGRLTPHLQEHQNADFHWSDSRAVYPGSDQREGGDVRSTQVGGDHYRQTKIQPWDIVDAWGLDFYRGSALKYLLRAGRKGPAVEDLKKAKHYIEKCIEREGGE